MNSKKSVIIGVFCLILGVLMITQINVAETRNNTNNNDQANPAPAVNDYSKEGAEYDGERPQNHIKKGYRSTEAETTEAESGPERAEPIINDYSSMGEEYGAEPQKPEANRNSSITVGPTVNDYSSMGAEYGASSADSAEETDSSDAAAGQLQPADASQEDLVVGHEKYHGNCAQCHGEDAVGSTFAPSLVDRMRDLDYPEFVDVITNGKTVFNSATGGYSVMPAWKNNNAVMAHMNELWAYLKARSEGELGTGRPK